MRYYRCKCGKREAWGSDSPRSCRGCSECGTTLVTHPDLHREPAPHDWEEEWTVGAKSGWRGKVRRCTRCYCEEVLSFAFTVDGQSYTTEAAELSVAAILSMSTGEIRNIARDDGKHQKLGGLQLIDLTASPVFITWPEGFA
jgi:hypothetical protein